MIKTIFSILLVTAAGAILLVYTRPTYDGLQEKQARIASYDAALTKAADLQKKKDELSTKYNSFDQPTRDRLERMLPDHVDNVGLILDIDHLASQHSMSVENVDVNTSSKSVAGGAQGAGASGIGAVDNGKKYDSLTITFNARGSYQHFTEFLTDLQNSLRLVDLESLTVAISSPGSDIYVYKVALRTYWLK